MGSSGIAIPEYVNNQAFKEIEQITDRESLFGLRQQPRIRYTPKQLEENYMKRSRVVSDTDSEAEEIKRSIDKTISKK